MKTQNDLNEVLKDIAKDGYVNVYNELYAKTKGELNNALAFIEVQKDLIITARQSGIQECLVEIRAARAHAPREAHIYLDMLIKTFENRLFTSINGDGV